MAIVKFLLVGYEVFFLQVTQKKIFQNLFALDRKTKGLGNKS
jgi:hypothetical protein